VSLLAQLKNSYQPESKEKEELITAIENGRTFFQDFNDRRIKLALASFSEDMKKALFEVIFFLHVNDPKFENHTYLSTRVEEVYGVAKEVEYEATANLYVEDSPSGVVGINALSTLFSNQFEQHIHVELDYTITEEPAFSPIYSIASLGSIGTVGHKETASDLDLQVQYELEPFLINPAEVSDKVLLEYAKRLIDFYSKKFSVMKKYFKNPQKEKQFQTQIRSAGHANFKKRFPLLYDVLVGKKDNVRKSAMLNQESKQKLIAEVIGMVKLYSKICLKNERIEKEQLLKEKIKRIQDYVQKKYPKAEVYLFAYSNDDYRDGKHGTTLESKEASGSAYELILNYETLMPGIQFSPMIPIHFLMPPSVNASRPKYEEIVDNIRFGFTNLYDKSRYNLVDLGSTPPLTPEYMTAHSGAMYWESFKAASGNLPKATLNLLRFEMLFDKRFNTSIIELIKTPQKLDEFSGDAYKAKIEDDKEEEDAVDEVFELAVDDFYDDYGLEEKKKDKEPEEEQVLGEEVNPEGLTMEQIFRMEKRFPDLEIDPWWLRYKALKIGFGPDNQSIKDGKERDLVSRVIDMGFALHIKVSDIFTHLKDGKKFESYRQEFMGEMLKLAFPVARRRYLEHICNGETSSVIAFEKDLKFLFKRSMKRVNEYINSYGGKDQSNQEEYRIWYHYYEQNFDPPKNVIRRDILSDLKIPRGRLQIGINDKGAWFFRSLQKSALESRYDTFGQLDHLPDEVDLFQHNSFLHGIGHCLLNGYYGVTNKGTLRESRTHLEYVVGHTEIGKASADKWAYIRPDIVDRLVDNMDTAFPPQEYDFRDCIYKKKEVVNVFICLNLLEYGRVSFMYRDNLKTWCVDEIDHPEVEKQAQTIFQNMDLLFVSLPILETIHHFIEGQEIDITKEDEVGISFWVNPTSIKTFHPSDKYADKEKMLARLMKKAAFSFIKNGGQIVDEEEVEEEPDEEDELEDIDALEEIEEID
jgi:hypothetical protein